MNAEMNFRNNGINFIGEEKTDKMNKTEKMNEMDTLKEMGVISDKCSCSGYSMVTVAGGILLAIGTVIYSLIAM